MDLQNDAYDNNKVMIGAGYGVMIYDVLRDIVKDMYKLTRNRDTILPATTDKLSYSEDSRYGVCLYLPYKFAPIKEAVESINTDELLTAEEVRNLIAVEILDWVPEDELQANTLEQILDRVDKFAGSVYTAIAW